MWYNYHNVLQVLLRIVFYKSSNMNNSSNVVHFVVQYHYFMVEYHFDWIHFGNAIWIYEMK